MKKTFLLLTVSLLCAILSSFAQVTFPSNTFNLSTDYVGWDGTVGSPPLLLKTTNPDPINFYTNNLPRMTIDATGRFGLGTSTPLGLFHMDDNASSNTDFRITNASTVNTASGTLLTRCLCAETSFIN